MTESKVGQQLRGCAVGHYDGGKGETASLVAVSEINGKEPRQIACIVAPTGIFQAAFQFSSSIRLARNQRPFYSKQSGSGPHICNRDARVYLLPLIDGGTGHRFRVHGGERI